MKAYVFVQRLRRISRRIVRKSTYRHDPLLINSLAAFNFRRPLLLEFPAERLTRISRFDPVFPTERGHPKTVDENNRGDLHCELLGQRLLGHRRELARHGKRYPTTSVRSEQLRESWTDRSCRSLRTNYSRARNASRSSSDMASAVWWPSKA